jgi:hypothetical protein
MVTPKEPAKRKPGRIPAGKVNSYGQPELVSKYPKLTISMTPGTKARLEGLSTLRGVPAWRIVDEALSKYMESVPLEDRKAVEGMARRIEERLTA